MVRGWRNWFEISDKKPGIRSQEQRHFVIGSDSQYWNLIDR